MGQIQRIRHPEIFQGNLKKRHYFEGWYYKIISADLQTRFAFIPGISLDNKTNTSHAFIQVFNGITLDMQYFRFPITSFKASPSFLDVQIGNSAFSLDHIRLDIDQDNYQISGDIELKNIIPWPKPSFGWGIMGPFAYIPFMECRHDLVSMNHELRGHLKHNEKNNDFSGGRGYIEKDWGTSFPSAYIWMQSNHFKDVSASIMVSIARIPSFGLNFTGFIGALWINGDFYQFTTYSKAKLSQIQIEEKHVKFTLEDKKYAINVEAFKGPGVLLPSPNQGSMSNRILESLQGEIHLELIEKRPNENKTLFKGIGKCAGVEIMATHESLHLK
jgi:hypothetical protein